MAEAKVGITGIDFSGLVHTGIEKLRSKLLDLSMSNRLLNFKHSEKSKTHIRIIDEISEVLFDKLEQRKSLQFDWIEDPDVEPADEQTIAFREAFAEAKETDSAYLEQRQKFRQRGTRRQIAKVDRALKDRVRTSLGLQPRTDHLVSDRARELHINPSYDLLPNLLNSSRSHSDSSVQTLLYRESMDSKLAAIREGDKTLLEDAGINALHTAFGFIEWYDSIDSEIAAFAPLLFYPVEIQRTLEDGLYKYVLAARDDDIETNQAFAELIKASVGLELPPWDREGSLSDYFERVQRVLTSQRRWQLKRWVTVGLFTFSKLAMYSDLDSRRWAKTGSLKSHPILNDLLVGTESISEVTVAQDYNIDSPDLSAKHHVLVTDADSSQHSAVIDVLEGKNVVIQGPPGTGKSQTITNIIASAINSGKRILFLAEKMAALQVVKDRLDHFGLGQFCLEVHSNKTRKTAVLKSLEDRLNFPGPQLNINRLRQTLEAYEQARNQLIYYVGRMKDEVGETGMTVHAILCGNCIRVAWADLLHPDMLKLRIEQPLKINPLGREELKELSRRLQSHAAAIDGWRGLSCHPWRGVRNDNLDIFQSDELISGLQRWKDSLALLRNKIVSVSSENGWSIEPSLRSVKQFIEKVRDLPTPDDAIVDNIVRSVKTPLDLSRLTDITSKVEKLAQIQNEIAQHTENIDLVFELGSTYFQRMSENAMALGLSEVLTTAVEDISTQKQRTAEYINNIQIAAMRFVEIFGIKDPRLSDLEKALTAISLLEQIPRNTLRYRDPAVMSEEHLRDLEHGAQYNDSLQKLKSTINEGFRLSLVPDLPDIKKAAHSLLSSGMFRRIFSQECREAKKLYKTCSIPGANRKRKSAGHELASLATYLQYAKEIQTNKDLQRCCGRFYRGAETPWRDLIAISQWGTKVRQSFPSGPEVENSFSEVLLRADIGRLNSLLEFAQSKERAFLEEFLAKSSEPRESSLRILATSERAGALGTTELAISLKQLKWNSNSSLKDIEKISGKVEEAEELRLKLTGEQVRKLIGSDGGLWIDKASSLRETTRYLSNLVDLSLPEAFWKSLDYVPAREIYESLNNQAQNLADALAHVGEHQDYVCRLAEIKKKAWIGVSDLDEVNLRTLETRIGYAVENKSALQPYLEFLRVEMSARNTPLAPILDSFQNSTARYERLQEAFEFVFYRSCAESLLKEDSKLSSHSGESHEQLRKRYQQLDRNILELRRQQIAATLMISNIPPGIGRGKASDFTDLALIRRQIGLQKRHVALRDLFSRAGNAIQVLKPCFMMSPMSVAQFLEPEGLRFDIVVMDEASQIRPEDAIGAIARSTQIVVVGDSMQLPPTSFFEKVDRDEAIDEDSDEAEVQELTGQESILDLARGPYQPIRRLGWHYRSQHEDLIAFSNREFYDTSLVVFPSPRGKDPNFGVHVDAVNGIYESSLNRIEAEALVTASQSFMREFPHRSLGIVAMNKPQQELIQKMMDDLFATDVEAEAYRLRWENTLEKLFVKNLENVQGDERDVIFVSTVYGKDSAGNFYQRLGPLNGAYGHRRLNVLFTRAKQQVRLFTSMKSGDLRVEPTTRWGVKALKNYLAYGESGRLEHAELTGRPPDSEFEQWVIQMLEEQGYEVVPQLGVAGYFLDIAIRHPDHNRSFIIVVDCHGAKYH